MIGEIEAKPHAAQNHLLEKSLVAAAVLLLVAAVYARTWAQFALAWRDEDNAHGAFVVPLVAFLVWSNWPRLRAVPIEGSRTRGLAVLIPALCLQIGGVWLGLVHTIDVSFVIAVAGLCLYFGGTRLTRALAFPLAFLLFMVPAPGAVRDILGAPLQLLSARMAGALAGLSGVSVQSQGVTLLLPARDITLQVAVGCSGLHSLTAMCMLAALLAYLLDIPAAAKWGLFALAIPLALIGNIVRIAIVILIANAQGQAPAMAFHNGPIGKLVPFGVAFLIVLGLGRWIERRQARKRPAAAS